MIYVLLYLVILVQILLITILEKNVIYKFRISDLINIINKSLSHSLDFFADPQTIKNPYTNLPFSICNLYNIYFKIKNSNYNLPILFHQFFVSNFEIVHFKNNNESLIRDKTIHYFLNKSTLNEKYIYILKMFYTHYKSVLFEIDILFPKKKINKYIWWLYKALSF